MIEAPTHHSPQDAPACGVLADAQDQSKQIRCLHCGQLSKARFCCSGCESVYTVLSELGMLEFYRWSTESSTSAAPVSLPPPVAWEAFRSVSIDTASERTSYTFELDGIHCAGCLWLLERLPRIDRRIVASSLNMSEGKLQVEFLSLHISVEEIARLLARLGYTPKAPGGEDEDRSQNKQHELLRIGFAGFAAMNTMMFAISLFEGYFSGIDQKDAHLFRWLSLALTAPTVFWSGAPLYRQAIKALRFKQIHIELPLTAAIFSAFILSVINTIAGSLYVYYDSICLLVFLLLVSRHFNSSVVDKARQASRIGWALLPAETTVVKAGRLYVRSVKDLLLGDRVLVRAGERFPADGVVIEGNSTIDHSVLTGESLPTTISTEGKVSAGALNLSSALTVQITEVGDSTRIARLISRLRPTRHSGGRITQFTDKVARFYVVALSIAAAISLFVHYQDPLKATSVVLTLLAVTCPCALAFSVPTIYGVFIGECARRGILVKSTAVLENLPDIRSIFLDKTGTLTTGEFKLVSEIWKAEKNKESLRALHCLTSASSNHPIAVALRNAFSFDLCSTLDAEVTCGKGVQVEIEGKRWKLGTPSWANSREPFQFTNGLTPVVLTCNESTVAEFELGDSLRPSTAPALVELQRSGFSLEVLSGDHTECVEAIVAQIPVNRINVIGSLTPEGKATHIKSCTYPNLFIGDGVNDILAMRAATVGVALAGGLEATVESADIVVTRGSLDRLRELLAAANRTRRIVYFGLGVSISYNCIACGITLAGYMHPLVAAFLMPTSSMAVMAIALIFNPFSRGALCSISRR